MNAEQWQQELQEQLLMEIAAGVSDTNYYDDGSIVAVEVDYTTQSWPVWQVSQQDLILEHTFAILQLFTTKQPMWDEIQDMPGEIFDIKEEDLMAVFDDTISEDLDKETKKLLDQF